MRTGDARPGRNVFAGLALGGRAVVAPAAAGLAVVGLAALAGCTSPPPAPYTGATILQSNAPSKTVQLDLVGAENDNLAGFNFDGYGDGQMTVRVPVGWTVDVSCSNASTALSHSCAVVEQQPLAPSGAPIAFPGAVSASAASGLAYGRTSSFSFVASKVGRYRIACLVGGHEVDGMWDWFIVTPGGSPSVST